MIFFLFLCFLIFYFWGPKKDRFLFYKSGWLYFISHFQLFMIGFISLLLTFASFLYGLFYGIFFFDFNWFVLPLFFSAFLSPFAFDTLSYAFFGSSFFLERFLFKGKNIVSSHLLSFYSFLNFYVRVCFFCISFVFFLLFYLLFIALVSFIVWSLLNFRNFFIDLMIFFIEGWFIVPAIFIFFFPLMIEMFYYSIHKSSFFIKFKDF